MGVAIVEAGQFRSSLASQAGVIACIGAVIILSVALGARRQRTSSALWLSDNVAAVSGWRRSPGFALGVVVWIVLVLAVVGWDLSSFVAQAHDLPTLSGLAGRVTQFHVGRAVVFAAWVALGLGLGLGYRRPR